MAHQLTMEEGEILSQMNYAGESQADMGRRFERHPRTICRELKQNCTHDGYFANVAHRYARVRRQVRWWGQKKMEQGETETFVCRGRRQYWSPEQIAGRSQRDFPNQSKRRLSRQTIYNGIKNQRHRKHGESYLRRGGKKRRPPKKDPPT